jgi:endoglucanase
VIIDWHDHHAQNHIQRSKEFFKIIAQKYGDKPNIIYEIYNEPLMVSWSNVIKPYAKEVIKVILQYGPDNLILAFTPTWSLDVDIASRDIINDVNLAYTFHFYTGTHTEWLRNKAIDAMKNGVALFVSEYGISEANGGGKINYAETEKWLPFIYEYSLCSCNWSIIDKDKTNVALKPGADPYGGLTADDLSESVTFIRTVYFRKI